MIKIEEWLPTPGIPAMARFRRIRHIYTSLISVPGFDCSMLSPRLAVSNKKKKKEWRPSVNDPQPNERGKDR